MTDEDAIATLQSRTGGMAWISWDDEANRPRWDSHGYIMIDGDVSANELRALLHFAPQGEQP